MERAHKYEFEGKVRYSEIDHRATMTLPALINYFQDCSTFQSEQLGYGMDVLKKEKKAWVLAYWQVIVKRYPKLCERITVGTFASGFKGMFGNRNFYMKDESGEQIACANSIWVYMDVNRFVLTKNRRKPMGLKNRWKCRMRTAKSKKRSLMRKKRRFRCENTI